MAPSVVEILRQTTQRVRRLHQSPLAPGASPALAPHWQRTLELVQALSEWPTSPLTVMATESLNELLAEIERSLRALESHLALCEFLLTTAERLHPIVDEIALGAETSSRRLFNLAIELSEFLHETHDQPCIVPVPGFAPMAVLEQAGWARADWFAQAVFSARLMAAAWPALELPTVTRGWLTAAALVQDIGCWHQPQRFRHQQTLYEGRRRAEPNHPATGAAIIHGLNDGSVVLSLLVGTHHERIDGTGYPQRLSGQRITREQQCLGLLVRITELLLDPLTGELAVEHAEPLETTAGLRLWREVRRGSFAEPLARIMLDSLRIGLTEEVQTLYPTRVQRLLDVPHPVPAPLGQPQPPDRFDAPTEPDSAVNQPVFLRRLRSRGGSLVRSAGRR